jgi:hypothetical protein
MTAYDDDDKPRSVLPDNLLQALQQTFPEADRDRGYHAKQAREVLWRVMPYVEDVSDVVEAALPYDGPHSRDTVIDAARLMAGAGRYLNNATQPHTADTTLAWASTIGSVLGNVKTTLYQLDQLLDQLAQAALRLAEDPTVYSDQVPYDRNTPRDQHLAARHDAGVTALMTLADQLRQIRPDLVTWDDHGFRPVGGIAQKLEGPHSLAGQLGHETAHVDD